MINLTDSFIQYLVTKLGSSPTVHWVRSQPNDETADQLQLNALNITVLGSLRRGSVEESLVSLDVIGTDERQVLAWVKTVQDVLEETQYTPEYAYTDPAAPAATGRMVSWDKDVSFRLIGKSPYVVQYNATLPICHARF